MTCILLAKDCSHLNLICKETGKYLETRQGT